MKILKNTDDRVRCNNIIKTERGVLESVMPGLDVKLSEISFKELESIGTPALGWFKEHGGPSLLIPKKYGGKGLAPIDMVRIQRALGYHSPSLALATNMHTCTVAAIPACDATADLLTSISENNLYVASGFAEGRSATSIQKPSIKVTNVDEGIILNGSKKPCSLAKSMDLFTASVLIPQQNGNPKFALVTVPSESDGLDNRPFTNTNFLAGAENMEIILKDVFVPSEFISYFGDDRSLSDELSFAFLWFEMFISASYLGVVTRLVEMLYLKKRGSPEVRSNLVASIETSMLALEGVAQYINNDQIDDVSVSRSLYARYHIQDVISKVACDVAEQLGGIDYLTNPNIPYLLTVSRALAFHPPSKYSMSSCLDNYIAGDRLSIP